MVCNYCILLPPSEGKHEGGTHPYMKVKKGNSFSFLHEHRDHLYDRLLDAITHLSNDELSLVLELKGPSLLSAIESLVGFLDGPTLPAIKRYSGVMFKSINYELMTESERNNFNKSVLFVDGLFGLLRPTDLIPDYKLKIHSKFLEINVTQFWKEVLSYHHDAICNGKLIVDILPQAHRKVLNYDAFENWYTINFCVEKKGKLVNVGHDSKVLKGELIRYIVRTSELSKEYLCNFKHSLGYKYSLEHSNEHTLFFLKK